MNTALKPKKLLDQVRDTLRVKHYAYRTEKSYIFWIRRFILFHEKKHPSEMGSKQIQEFLTYLAVERNVSASTQNQALNALIFLYKKVLGIELTDPIEAVRARRPTRLPVVLSKPEAFKVINPFSFPLKFHPENKKPQISKFEKWGFFIQSIPPSFRVNNKKSPSEKSSIIEK